jgi:hypothetical protein
MSDPGTADLTPDPDRRDHHPASGTMNLQ